MLFSRFHIPTLKEAPAEATSPSHVLLLRGGYIRQLTAGIYTFLPLGLRVLSKVMRIVREELARAGATEVLMPAVQPADLWVESGRWEKYGSELLRLKDRKGTDYCIGPTHEEVVVDLVRRDLRSYRQLPISLFQIQTKFRDEPRPRGGLLRGREFIMKDAYSFDVDETAARRSYQAMYDAYERIFRRCGLNFRAVEADTGNIGGTLSHEFQVLADTGEDAIVACDTCSYAANIEQAELSQNEVSAKSEESPRALATVATPGQHTVAQVAAFLGVEAKRLVKTLIYLADGKPVAVLVRGDREVNELKLRRALGVEKLVLATEGTVREATGGPVGFSGPVGLVSGLRLLADLEVLAVVNAVTGANKADAHHTGVCFGRDFLAEVVDLRQAGEGDPCGRCKTGHYHFFRGIEVGHVFYLGTKYSQPMKCRFLDEKGNDQTCIMGCYGIGITRVAAAAVEQNHDEAGIIWPAPLAPFQVLVVPAQTNVARVVEEARRLHDGLEASGVEVLLDDREERAGVKFKDADLLGIPWRVTVGERGLSKGVVELKARSEKQAQELPLESAASVIATQAHVS